MSTLTRMESGRNWRTAIAWRLARHPSGRAALHLAAWCRTRRNFAWHWAGVLRELRITLGRPPGR